MSNTRRPRNPATAQRPPTSRRTQIGIVAVAVACVVAIIALAAFFTNGDATTAASNPPKTTAPTTPPTTAPTTPNDLGCSKPPSPPSKPKQFKSAPSPALAKHAVWDATIKTTCGDIGLRLYGDKAPQTVASFLFLANRGYFADSPCHRLTTSGIFVLQCGDPTGSGSGTPGYGFGIENAPAKGDYPKGTLAMARASDPNSNGSQFFIVYKDTTLPTAGGGYSIFGRVTRGLGIVKGIAAQGVSGGGTDGTPGQPVSILSVSVHKH